MNKIKIKEFEISVTGFSDDDYISLTDLARLKNNYDTNSVIANWLRKVDTLSFITLWETLNNENFKPTDFEGFKSKPGENAFTISPKKWIEMTDAIGIKVKSGRYNSGTFAHKDIALEFAAWISSEIRLYIIKEFQRLKIRESNALEWKGKRLASKLNYLIQTESINEYLIPVELSIEQKAFIYANEADMLNVALFGKTAKEWSNSNIASNGNIRDHANLLELTILSNLEFYNAKLIEQGISSSERLELLNIEANKEKELFNNLKCIQKIGKIK